MGWEPFTSSLEAWFAEAWTRGLTGTATDLAWVVAMLRHPALTVSPGLRAILDAADDGADQAEPPEVLPDALLMELARELRATVARHARLHEPPARYRRARLRAAADVCPARSP